MDGTFQLIVSTIHHLTNVIVIRPPNASIPLMYSQMGINIMTGQQLRFK